MSTLYFSFLVLYSIILKLYTQSEALVQASKLEGSNFGLNIKNAVSASRTIKAIYAELDLIRSGYMIYSFKKLFVYQCRDFSIRDRNSCINYK